MDTLPRLDILLYAHDGRGLGHASRTIAIGMALRRLYPSLKVLFLSGCRLSGELIGNAPLDWLKLPSYETVVEGGVSRGIDGRSNFSDHQLGLLRSRQIADIIAAYRPRLVLADHSPQGKHKELRPALEDPANNDILWVLGVRSVVGDVSQLTTPLAIALFNQFYRDLLWYGDSKALGGRQLEKISASFNTQARECGYVSRLTELQKTSNSSSDPLAGIISIPWIGENTPPFLDTLHTALQELGGEHGRWEIYLESGHALSPGYHHLFDRLPWCTAHAPGLRYVDSLLHARCAIIYGGYNSIVDVLSVAVPALVVLRAMQDGEQQQHLDGLIRSSAELLSTIDEQVSVRQLTDGIRRSLYKKKGIRPSVNLDGAATSARHLAGLLENNSLTDRSGAG